MKKVIKLHAFFLLASLCTNLVPQDPPPLSSVPTPLPAQATKKSKMKIFFDNLGSGIIWGTVLTYLWHSFEIGSLRGQVTTLSLRNRYLELQVPSLEQRVYSLEQSVVQLHVFDVVGLGDAIVGQVPVAHPAPLEQSQ